MFICLKQLPSDGFSFALFVNFKEDLLYFIKYKGVNSLVYDLLQFYII